ncbi:peptidylprolyl isomerase [Cochleicola gelatinilyticus]|uniref:Peptidylprolyl isomerase n=1 Tax=Cochleicola gelatinilyticus TaxID=1763537 RepID=A0A167EMK2_9FLAO|nr:peptidylprolyl isomerase [Cochleicola gelatinilyticus]OAB75687.1 peptidylprolyl isomerase [Cochleicola gelatinilyticus]
MYKFGLLFVIGLLFVSCDYFKQDSEKVPIARVNQSFLYYDDIKDLISETTSKEDSTLIVTNYVNRWATQQLLLDQARINLPEEQLESYNKLVRDYKNELYTDAYKSNIVAQQLDSSVTVTEVERFYETNKENFKLNDPLYKVRYIHVPELYGNLAQAREMLKRFNDSDKKSLSALGIQFKGYNLNDSTWVEKSSLYRALPILKDKESQVLKKTNFTQLQDSLGVYLVQIEDILATNDIAPLSFLQSTIEQIILNKRKLQLIKKLEKDITQDAIKNSNFEIYKEN